MTAPLIEARDLSYVYEDGTPALAGASLSVRPGRRLALLGPNGAGKTTLLLHLNGLLRPRGGAVTLDGTPAAYDRRSLIDWRRRVGLVMQEPDDQLFAATVFEDVSFGPLNFGLSEDEVRARVMDALAALDIVDLADKPPHLLSYGQRRRAAIAGIAAARPEVMLLDEPTGGLDAAGQTHLLGLLDGLHEAGATIVLSTHDIELAHAWADEVALFADGKVIVQADARVVLRDAEQLARAGLTPPLAVVLAEAMGVDPPRDARALAALLKP